MCIRDSLPTVGITVLLPAIIIHLLDIKAPDEHTRRTALHGFCQCMQIMSQLRDIYAAADYSTAFLEATIRKAEIQLPQKVPGLKDTLVPTAMHGAGVDSLKQGINPHTTTRPHTHPTPPPEQQQIIGDQRRMTDADIAHQLHSFLAETPPASNGQGEHERHEPYLVLSDADMFGLEDFEPDFDALVNLDAAGEAFALDDVSFQPSLQAADHVSGFLSSDVDWMKGMYEDEEHLMA